MDLREYEGDIDLVSSIGWENAGYLLEYLEEGDTTYLVVTDMLPILTYLTNNHGMLYIDAMIAIEEAFVSSQNDGDNTTTLPSNVWDVLSEYIYANYIPVEGICVPFRWDNNFLTIIYI
jgi:hypothetical protein